MAYFCKNLQKKLPKMKKYLVALLLLFSCDAMCEEGMWLPHLIKNINEQDLQKSGLKLTAEDLYSINNSSIKDAIVSLSWGSCTGEMISSEGLMLTNHHCAYGYIQDHSSIKNDYIKNGFWAMKREAELPNEGLSASFLISIEEVTDSIIIGLNDKMSEAERNKKIKELSKKIIDDRSNDDGYNRQIKSFYGGNKFYLLTYETYKDVRLVGAPPSSIGKFGGDTDNWMWPRHTGDFALYRVYCGPDGKPAEFSEENIPYKPRHHLPIQLDGVENNDFTMIFGYPGSTDRYLTSHGVKNALEIKNPTIVDIRDEKLAIIKAGMDSDKKTKIQYAAKHARTANYWKYYIGQSKGLRSMKVYDKKLKQENEFKKWCLSNPDLEKKYGSALDLIEEGYTKNKQIEINRRYLNEAVWRGAEILWWSYKTNRSIQSLPKEKPLQKDALKKIKEEAKEFYKNYNASVDQELLASMLEMYYYNVPKNQHAPIFKKIENQLFGFKKLDFHWYAKNLFKRSLFASEEKFLVFLESPSNFKIQNDPAYKTISSIYNKYLEQIYPIRLQVREKLNNGNRLYIDGLQKMYPEKKYYPDANSTMRFTYGSVGDYNGGEATHYDYYTTIDGVFEKEDPSNEEFIIPDKLRELYETGSYGRYGDKDGNLRVNFISNNDITGGNSGSPVINAWGELVGTAFDGNWEAMSGDIAFEKEVQRTISVDIRYTLFIIDKFANAGHLIQEMTIAPKRKKYKNNNEKSIKENHYLKGSDKYIEELQLKNYNGVPTPKIDTPSFDAAFDIAKNLYGSSKDIMFWWNHNVYTTEIK